MPDLQTLSLAVGIIIGSFYYQRTGFSCGGIITPGVAALFINAPLNLLVAFVAALAVWGTLELVVRRFGVYGRQRLVVAMLLALAIRWPLLDLPGAESLWLGWVIPGLVGADLQRQGALATLPAVISATVVTAFVVALVT